MIPAKIKSAHYLRNRFKPLVEVKKWFKREDAIYSDQEVYELWLYFKRQCEKDLLLLTSRANDVKERESKIIATTNILRYCNDNIKKTK